MISNIPILGTENLYVLKTAKYTVSTIKYIFNKIKDIGKLFK